MSLPTGTYEGSPAEPVPGSMPPLPVVRRRRGPARIEPTREAAE
jgi:hypothetical protein